MATDMNMFVEIDNCKSSSVDRCEHESRELSLRTPVCYTMKHSMARFSLGFGVVGLGFGV